MAQVPCTNNKYCKNFISRFDDNMLCVECERTPPSNVVSQIESLCTRIDNVLIENNTLKSRLNIYERKEEDVFDSINEKVLKSKIEYLERENGILESKIRELTARENNIYEHTAEIREEAYKKIQKDIEDAKKLVVEKFEKELEKEVEEEVEEEVVKEVEKEVEKEVVKELEKKSKLVIPNAPKCVEEDEVPKSKLPTTNRLLKETASTQAKHASSVPKKNNTSGKTTQVKKII